MLCILKLCGHHSRIKDWCWIAGSTVKSTCYGYRGPGFRCQNPCGGSQSLITPVPVDPTPFYEPGGQCVWQIRGSLCAFAQGRLTITCRGASSCVRIQDHRICSKIWHPEVKFNPSKFSQSTLVKLKQRLQKGSSFPTSIGVWPKSANNHISFCFVSRRHLTK